MILLLCQQMPVTAAARHLAETDKRVWRVLDHYVMEAHSAKDWSGLRRLMIDESEARERRRMTAAGGPPSGPTGWSGRQTSTKKGHHYATNFMDADSRELLFTVEGKGKETLAAFAQEMSKHGACPAQITEIIMDMSQAFIAGAKASFPNARVIFDHFHIMKMAGEALDEVRKALAAGGAELKGSMWAIRGNEWSRSKEQLETRRRLVRQYPVLGRAIGLRDCLQDMLADCQEESLKWWCTWADRSRLEPFRKLSKTIKSHWQGILAFMETRLTNAAMEAVNGIIQIARRMARGFRNFHYFRIAAYLKAGGLQLNIVHE